MWKHTFSIYYTYYIYKGIFSIKYHNLRMKYYNKQESIDNNLQVDGC